MDSGQQPDLGPLKKGTAILIACVVQTLRESDASFETRFLDRLGKAYRLLKDDSEGDVHHQMELLAWTRELLTGFNLITGQGKPFLDN